MVSNIIDKTSFADLPCHKRVSQVFFGQGKFFKEYGSVFIGEVGISGKTATVIFTNGKKKGGTFGLYESQRLIEIIKNNRLKKIPLVFFLDSAGARLNDGFKALGAFRELYRQVLYFRLEGNILISMVVRNCFGGSSMIAAASSHKVLSEKAMFGMSGPKLMFEKKSFSKYKIENIDSIFESFSAKARNSVDKSYFLCQDHAEAYKALLNNILKNDNSVANNLLVRQNELAQRLDKEKIPEVDVNSTKNYKVGNGGGVGASEMIALSEYLLRAKIGARITITLNASSHAMNLENEQVILSDYMAHTALCLAEAKRRKISVKLVVKGCAGGGAYVSLASGCGTVRAELNAKFFLLPEKAVEAVIGKKFQFEISTNDFIKCGVVDEFMEK